MSQYLIASHDPDLVVTVGWDNPLSTYFGLVLVPHHNADDTLLLWAGAQRFDITTVDDLQTEIAEYATIPSIIRQQLQRDHDQRTPLTALQTMMTTMCLP